MYQAYNLTEESKQAILSLFVPAFSNFVLHHITYKFGVPKDSPLPPPVETVRVIGFMKNDHIECFVCSVDGSIERADGGIYHITFSHSDFASPKDSNELLEDRSSIQFIVPIPITVIPSLNQ